MIFLLKNAREYSSKHSLMWPLMTIEPYFDTCYGHAMSKCC